MRIKLMSRLRAVVMLPCLALISASAFTSALVSDGQGRDNHSISSTLDSLAFTQGRGTFEQLKYFKFLKQPIVSKGVFAVARSKVLWHTQSPVFSQILISQSGIFRRLDAAESYQMLVGNSPINQVLSSLLTGKIERDDWDIAMLNETESDDASEPNEQHNCIELIPKSSQLSQLFTLVRLCQNSDKVRKISLVDLQGNNTDIVMTVQTTTLSQDELNSLKLDNDSLELSNDSLELP